MKRFTCDCGNVLFFGSFKCLKCGGEVGYEPGGRSMQKVRADGDWRRCDNGAKYGVCNWLVPAQEKATRCVACEMNRTIPDLSLKRNVSLWASMETAKHRLLYTLQSLGIPLPSKREDPKNGLAFDIVSSVSNPEVTMGHLNGVITVNLEEADDTFRQINRQQLGERSRTLLGHFRHESGHYLWQRFLSELSWDDPQRLAFRERFGDEWLDYAAALSSHYEKGNLPNWEQCYISAYAASHPWEDWAETWSHYLQIVDGLDTCDGLGIHVKHLSLPLVMLPGAAGSLPAALPQSGAEDGEFLALLQRWLCVSTVFNEIAHSMGEASLYPFVISVRVAQKLRLAHHFARTWGVAS